MEKWFDLMFRGVVLLPVIATLGGWLYVIIGELWHRVEGKPLQEIAAHSVDVEID